MTALWYSTNRPLGRREKAMGRQKLTGNPRAWFDIDRAKRFPGTVRFDQEFGTWRSRATGSIHAHEDLYLTASGRWIIHWWSLQQGNFNPS